VNNTKPEAVCVNCGTRFYGDTAKEVKATQEAAIHHRETGHAWRRYWPGLDEPGGIIPGPVTQ